MLQVRGGQGCEQRRQQALHLAKVLQNLSVNRSNATSHHTGCTWRERRTPSQPKPDLPGQLAQMAGREHPGRRRDRPGERHNGSTDSTLDAQRRSW